jgi:MSHA biogenesis protein MshQ
MNTPTLDQVAVGVDTNLLPLTANMSQGTLSQNDLTALPGVVALPKGVLHYQLSDADNFFYNRSANALVAPFTSDIDFSVAAITDADNVNVTTTVDASPTGVEIRFGRLVLGNSFGPETSNFPQPMQLEHFDGTGFIVSSDNNCSNYDSSKMSLTNISLNPALTPKLGGAGSFQLGKIQAIELQAPGAGNQGQIGVSYDAYDWLKYDWDNDGVYDDSPSAIATFGIYRGNDRIIHWREVFE